MKKLLALLLVAVPLVALATDYTSTKDGNWSDTTVWGGGPPGIGDTATLNHNITVDVNTTVGTSPNNNTTSVVTFNNVTKTLTVNTNITLTIRGNMNLGNGAPTVSLKEGAGLVFDASASGGTPVYKLLGGQVYHFNCSGTSSAHCSVSAPVGHTCAPFTVASAVTWTYTDFTRTAVGNFGFYDGTSVISHCTWNLCDQWGFHCYPTPNLTVSDCIWTNTTASGSSAAVLLDGTYSSGTRVFTRNIISERFLTYNAAAFTITTNYIAAGIAATSTFTWNRCRANLLGVNGASGQVIYSSLDRNYIVAETGGNPHFVAPLATGGVDISVSQNVFESQSPDVVDTGDCMIVTGAASSGGKVIRGYNNLVLPDGYTGTTVSSGCLLTLFAANSGVVTEWYHNTANIDLSAASGRSGVIDVDESSSGYPGQVAVLKSTLAWGSTSGQGWLGRRVQGAQTNVITAAGADYNWVFNLDAGNNQRSYNSSIVTTNYMWAAGDAVAAGVDVHQGTGDPRFYDSARNMAKWCFDRGYGTQTYTNSVTVIQNDLTKIPDLINYVFEGYRPANPAMRNAAHDGDCVGAANWYQPRNTNVVLAYRAGLSVFGL